MKISNSFILSIAGLASLVLMFLTKGLDTSGAIVSIVLGYAGLRAGQKVGVGIAASKDPNSKVSDIINEIK
jgi:hypothetical protein